MIIRMYKILMVDDDSLILEDNKTYFRAMGYEVVCAGTAEEAEKIILSNALDCIILDVDLPDMSGFALCEKYAQRQVFPLFSSPAIPKKKTVSADYPSVEMTMYANLIV